MTQKKRLMTAFFSVLATGVFFATTVSAAIIPINAATFTDSADDEASDIEDDPTTLLSFTAGATTYSDLQAATSASNFAVDETPGKFWPGDPDTEQDTEPSSGADAIANLEVLDGGLNVGSVDV